jgi:hypothetical protein
MSFTSTICLLLFSLVSLRKIIAGPFLVIAASLLYVCKTQFIFGNFLVRPRGGGGTGRRGPSIALGILGTHNIYYRFDTNFAHITDNYNRADDYSITDILNDPLLLLTLKG